MKRHLIAALKQVILAELELKLFSWEGDKGNPVDEKEAENSGAFVIEANKNGKEVGSVYVYRDLDKWYVYDANVEEAHRRQGIATKLYDYADTIIGKEVLPQVLDQIEEPQISKDAFLFWKKRNPEIIDDILDSVIDENREELLQLV